MNIENLLDNTDLITALKWTGTILITGFIAQFGRRFAEHLIDRNKKRRETKRLKKNSLKEPGPFTEDSLVKEVKAPWPEEIPAVEKITPEMIEKIAKAKKKEEKALAKTEKKRLKAEKIKLK